MKLQSSDMLVDMFGKYSKIRTVVQIIIIACVSHLLESSNPKRIVQDLHDGLAHQDLCDIVVQFYWLGQ